MGIKSNNPSGSISKKEKIVVGTIAGTGAVLAVVLAMSYLIDKAIIGARMMGLF